MKYDYNNFNLEILEYCETTELIERTILFTKIETSI